MANSIRQRSPRWGFPQTRWRTSRAAYTLSVLSLHISICAGRIPSRPTFAFTPVGDLTDHGRKT